jgi:hypothetical protein
MVSVRFDQMIVDVDLQPETKGTEGQWKKVQEVVGKLRSSESLWKLALYIDWVSISFPLMFVTKHSAAVFSQYGSRLHSHCKTTLDKIEESQPDLQRPFKGMAFSALTFNLGPRVYTKPHRDMENLTQGFSSITSFGSFDYKKGGHLLLWDLGITIKFPAHSTISSLLHLWNIWIPWCRREKQEEVLPSTMHPLCSLGEPMGSRRQGRQRRKGENGTPGVTEQNTCSAP